MCGVHPAVGALDGRRHVHAQRLQLQADQQVRGSVSMPKGTGKTARVICFCGDDKVAAAKEAGAFEAGGAELVEKVNGGWMDFDVAIASPDQMRVVSPLGRVLGPKGLMPSPKAGTVTPDVITAVQEFSAGKVEYRNDDGGNVACIIGNVLTLQALEAG